MGLAQQAQVVRNVNLRGDPSTDNPPIRLLTPPEVVTLIQPGKTAGYYHVQTDEGEEGWVWSHNVQIIETTPTQTPVPVEATATPVPGLTLTPIAVPTQTPSLRRNPECPETSAAQAKPFVFSTVLMKIFRPGRPGTGAGGPLGASPPSSRKGTVLCAQTRATA